MDITSALDIAVGLVLLYLVLSLFCTTINEFISGVLRLRASTLKAALEKLIDDETLKKNFDNHGLIDTARIAVSGGKTSTTPVPDGATADVAGGGTVRIQSSGIVPPAAPQEPGWLSKLWNNADPSYLPSKTVALALIGAIDPTKPIPGMQDLIDGIDKLKLNSNIKDVLRSCVVEAGGDINKLRDSIAAWFDGAMDRLSGAYKRNLQLISLCVGLALAVLFNADTLHVGNALWHDRSLAQAIAQSAPALMAKNCPNGKCDEGGTDVTPDQAADKMVALEDNLRQFPIGWTAMDAPCSFADWVWKIVGLVLTSVALSMGAPFWFDILQKIMNFRATGEEPKKTGAPG